jgi:UDP-N-acetylmuramoyl-L-alanyl-D-glutamate--2,6-diaminopimelate ligase
MRLKELLKMGDVEEVEGSSDQPVAGLVYDSRNVKQGDVFFAFPGSSNDGHEFVAEAVERGAAAVVLERKVAVPESVTWVRVRNVRRTMGLWAAAFYAHPSQRMVLVGVTGTNGKTTVTYLLESIFASAGMPSGVIGTINYRYGDRVLAAPHTTPESVDLQALVAEMADAGVRSVGMEVSSHALDMERVRGMNFDGALFTNLSRDHLDFHGEMERYFLTKTKLFTDYLVESSKLRKFAVIHGSDPRGRELIERVAPTGLEVVSYGLEPHWDIHPVDFTSDLDGLRGTVQIKGQRVPFSTGLIGTANMENVMGAIAVGFALGIPNSVIVEGVTKVGMVPGRLERIHNRRGLTILVDYAHTPDALEKMLQAIGPLSRGRLIVLFGCGGDRDRGKRSLMGEIAGRYGDLVILTSDNPRTEDPNRILDEIEDGIRRQGLRKVRDSEPGYEMASTDKRYWVEADRRTAIRWALQLARADDLILVAGKGHEDYQILGKKRIHFDDREVIREEMEQLPA